MPQPTARDRFVELLRTHVRDGSLTKLTLGKYRGGDVTLKNLFVRPVALKSGPHLAFVWRHATRDVTKNHPPLDALALLEALVGGDFLDAHLFTATTTAQFESNPDGTARLKVGSGTPGGAGRATTHDRPKTHLIPPDAPWLHALGVTNDRGQPREGMADKYRQIQKFAEILSHLVSEAFPTHRAATPTGPLPAGTPPLAVVDMGSGKGYLTFAIAALLNTAARVRGIEARPELAGFCQKTAVAQGLGAQLTFNAGTIADTPLPACDVLIALHACDTATDDALARGIAAGAKLLVVAPCCQKELRPQLTPPAVLAGALRHGIFQERQSEFVTDALRAQLLEAVGYRTRVFEFISTEHTAKNLMIAAIREHAVAAADPVVVKQVQSLAAFYGVRSQRLAKHLGIELSPGT